MRKFSTRILLIISFIFIILSFVSCNESERNFYLTEHVQYLETPQTFDIYDIQRHSYDFTPMNKSQRENFSKVLSRPDTYLWLKIDFVVPTNLLFRDLAFYIPQLHSASRVYINGKFAGQYGSFPPHEQGAGFQSQIFLFSKEDLDYKGVNNIYIQCWPGIFGGLYGDICIGNQDSLSQKAATINFHNSRITLIFAGIMLVLFMLYIFLYYVIKRFETNKEYLYYALSLFYTVHFLVPFFLPEISWIKANYISYLSILKIFGGIGAVATIYFANSFILTYLNHKATIKNTVPRLLLFVIPSIGILLIPSYEKFTFLMLIYLGISLIQFFMTVPILIKSLFQKENRRHGILLLLGFFPVTVAVIIDIVIRTVFDHKASPFYTIYGWQITILIFLGFLLVRFSKFYFHNGDLKNQLEDINAHLEDLVVLRTKELSDANSKLSMGLETVAHVQNNFLPPRFKNYKGWDIAAFYRPLDSNVSGDLYDYFYTNEKLDGIGLFDVSGHGISAGLMTILAKGIISQEFHSGTVQEEPLSAILEKINQDYIKEKVDVENYITGVLFRFEDFNKHDVCPVELANAGHPAPLFYSTKQKTIIELKHSDSSKQYGFIGMSGLEVSFPSIYFTAQTNDIIVCFTDGLTDAVNTKGENFSKKRLSEIIEHNKDKSAEYIRNSIENEWKHFADETKIDDDVSFIVLKRTNSADYIEEI